ncbi:MAG: 4-hydroxy-tetrahydrodipicolinate synthase [Firmicutes bacterium]|nr:4-hydroxy-tetrahydrodipicolinate synthase [Bacillota bacterium]MBQ2041895.1 4-hydroxy-tetrahydrodipicolinate synthase [Bacillota bacterium]MBQ6670585.1 4-hydroxy-tetrahydrodipicolinate synthase [Bacillota bacterium]
MKKVIFRGACTALVTPMNEKGVDYDALERLINWQIDEGIDALLICGTTGECATLSDEEHREVFRKSMEFSGHRVPMIAGTGSNDTAYAIELTKVAYDMGYDAGLLVSPYYNKTTQAGLIAMYTAIADSSPMPEILYNVPGRTGMNIEPKTYAALGKHPNIVGIKEANGDMEKIVETMAYAGNDLCLWSGEDGMITPMLSMGGDGVISVLSNILPKKTSELCHAFFRGDVKKSAQMQLELTPLIKMLFCETNPIPARAAVAALGFGENYVRLPLVPMTEGNKARMLELMREQGLNV